MPLRVLHLVGSAADETYAELSRLYARGCLEATRDATRYDVEIVYVSPDGTWRFPADLQTTTIASCDPLTLDDALVRLARRPPDVMVPQMFCKPGMTTYRALFDVLEIPYVGNRADVMALGADKAKAKAVVAAAGVAVPRGEVLRRGDSATMAPPVVVKPVDADNSFGVTLVVDPAQYPAALAAALEHSDAALVEQFVAPGREVRCATVVRDGQVQCLPMEEYSVDAITKPVRDAADKLRRRDGDGGLELVAKDASYAWVVDVDDPITAPVWAAARACHEALDCRHYGLFDFRVDAAGTPYFLEAGLYNSFSPQSVIAVLAAAAGIGLPELFADAIEQAVGRPAAVSGSAG